LKLKHRLRDNSALYGDKGIRFKGLTAEQMMKVDEYAENLKNGKDEFPVDDKSYELTRRVKELELELKGTHDLSHIVQLLHKLLENRGGQEYNKF